jgi:hypothetical protein
MLVIQPASYLSPYTLPRDSHGRLRSNKVLNGDISCELVGNYVSSYPSMSRIDIKIAHSTLWYSVRSRGGEYSHRGVCRGLIYVILLAYDLFISLERRPFEETGNNNAGEEILLHWSLRVNWSDRPWTVACPRESIPHPHIFIHDCCLSLY